MEQLFILQLNTNLLHRYKSDNFLFEIVQLSYILDIVQIFIRTNRLDFTHGMTDKF